LTQLPSIHQQSSHVSSLCHAMAPTATVITSLPGSHTHSGLSLPQHPQTHFPGFASQPSSQTQNLHGRHQNMNNVNNNKSEALPMIPQTVYAHDRIIHLKGDPDGSSSGAGSPPMSPINMETQEKIKLERKRARNRVAATKCRKRKLDRISHLEGKVNDIKDNNSQLGKSAQELRHQVSELKKQILNHCQMGCAIQFLGEGGQNL
jgi:FtsZ-binding cell division protein ZapB